MFSETVAHRDHGKLPVASIFPASQNKGFERGSLRRVEAREHVFCEGDPRTHVFRVEDGVIAPDPLYPNQITYRSDPNYVGPDSFTYTVQDNEHAVSNVATVSLNISSYSWVLPAPPALHWDR